MEHIRQDWIVSDIPDGTRKYTREELTDGVVLDGVFSPEKIRLVEEFLNHGALYRDVFRLQSTEEQREVSRQAWHEAPSSDRFCFRQFYTSPKPGHEEGKEYRAFDELGRFLEGPFFARFLHGLTGELYVSKIMGWVRHRQGHFLVAHDDLPYGKMLSLTLYLASGWHENFGGELTMFRKKGEIQRIAPLQNRLVLLKPAEGYEHKVERLAEEAGDWERHCVVVRCYDPLKNLSPRKVMKTG